MAYSAAQTKHILQLFLDRVEQLAKEKTEQAILEARRNEEQTQKKIANLNKQYLAACKKHLRSLRYVPLVLDRFGNLTLDHSPFKSLSKAHSKRLNAFTTKNECVPFGNECLYVPASCAAQFHALHSAYKDLEFKLVVDGASVDIAAVFKKLGI